jgi:hypothetical protein
MTSEHRRRPFGRRLHELYEQDEEDAREYRSIAVAAFGGYAIAAIAAIAAIVVAAGAAIGWLMNWLDPFLAVAIALVACAGLTIWWRRRRRG